MSNQLVIFFLAILTLISAVLSEIVTFENCQDNSGKCTIHEVRVNPCAEASEGKPCRMKRGKPASIHIDFTPNFASETLNAKALWANGIVELPLVPMEMDACKTTLCPLVEGRQQTYSYDLQLSRAFPTGVFPVKYKLFGEQDDDECCLLIRIQLK